MALSKTPNWKIVSASGRHTTESSGAPSEVDKYTTSAPNASTISTKGGTTVTQWVQETYDQYRGGGFYSAGERNADGSFAGAKSYVQGSEPYVTEYIVSVTGGSAGFTLGENITQFSAVKGATCTGVVTFWEYNTIGQFEGNSGVSGWMLGLKNVGVTGGTGGPTGPIVGLTAATEVIKGAGGATWACSHVSVRIQPDGYRNRVISAELRGITATNFSAIKYGSVTGPGSAAKTADMGQSLVLVGQGSDGPNALKIMVDANHSVYTIAQSQFMKTVQLYYDNGTSLTIDAVSGGSGGVGNTWGGGTGEYYNSELNELVYAYNYQKYLYDSARSAVYLKYVKTSASRILDSVYKINTVAGITV